MSELKISEAGDIQFPIVDPSVEIGSTSLTPREALYRRGGEAGS